MLEMHNGNLSKKEIPAKNEPLRARPSKLWLLLSLAIFAVIIFAVLYVLLRLRFIYLPGLSAQFGGSVAPTYQISEILSEPVDLTWQDWTTEDGFVILTLSEEKVTAFIRKYFDPKWQIIFNDHGFEFFGRLYTAVNNEDYWSEVKVIYEIDTIKINLNGFDVPESLNKFLLNYIISSEGSADTSEKYFEKIDFMNKKVSVFFSEKQKAVLLKDFNTKEFFSNFIKYLFYQN